MSAIGILLLIVLAVPAPARAQTSTSPGTASASASAKASADRPNIIYIMADDLGYGDLGCYGQTTLKTPHLDRMAAEGLRFTDHYAGHTVCRPSRLVLMTGRHSGNTAISSNADYHFPEGAVTVTSLLHDAGYRTGGIGKWALGEPGTSGVPRLQGFDFWFGYLDQSRAHNFYPEYLWMNGDQWPLAGNVEGPKRNISTAKETWSHTEMTAQALQWIREARARQPFFFQAHYTVPHTNNEAGREFGDGQEVPDYGQWADRDWPNPEKGFAEMITRLDSDVGKLFALLEELGIDDDTVVFFTSDNGPHQEGGHKMEFFDSNGALRGYKRDLYDGGIRVPMIARWPGKIAAGTTTDHPSAFWDFLPTACELAGVDIPADLEVDGISYLPTLLGEEQETHDYLYWQARPKQAVRRGHWKAVRLKRDGPVELYDLRSDIGEQTDIAAEHRDIVESLTAILDRYDE